MLPEHRATSYAQDLSKGSVIIVTDAPAGRLQGDVVARLLLDAGAHLVGVDVSPDSPDRMVVMLGAHEEVVTTMDAHVWVDGGGRTITLHGTAAKSVATGASPYVP